MKKLSLILLFIASLAGLWSCNEDEEVSPNEWATIRGQVLLNTNRKPVSKALIRLSPSGRIAETDSLGRFRFDSVAVGNFTVQVTKDLYRTEVSSVETDANLVSVLTFLLTEDKSQNRPPSIPSSAQPASGTQEVSTTVTLKWKATDPGRDTLTYAVALYKEGSITPTASYTGVKADTLLVSGLSYQATYYWQVTAYDGVNTVKGDMWSFKTKAFPKFSFLYTRVINKQRQLFTSNATGEVIQLTSEGNNWRPVVSPNRKRVAFISNRDTEPHLYTMNMDGTDVQKVTSVPLAGRSQMDLSFCWSPTGTELLYPSNDRLYAVRPDGTGLRLVARAPSGRVFAGCDWTAQGNLIVARTTGGSIYDNQLHTMPAGGGSWNTVLSRSQSRMGNPVISIDGKRLLFTLDASGFENDLGQQLDSRMYLFTLATGELTDISQVTSDLMTLLSSKPAGTNDTEPRFSPNGAFIIFTNTDAMATGSGTLYTCGLDGRSRTQIVLNAENPYWF